MDKIKRCSCPADGKFLYTLKETCPKCGSKTRSVHPMKFSPEDRYGKYRRAANYTSDSPRSLM
ncbi:MAG: nucleolar RNA-binding Nop10p family protein [Candidatus Aenigmarchaeota archaeon]|nr:nucleolar RNA-binding Nop10p family protein [Candidatus Aenigmarchaeota archaeon]